MLKKIIAGLAMLAPLAGAQAYTPPNHIGVLNGFYWTNGYSQGVAGTPDSAFLVKSVCLPSCDAYIGDNAYLSDFIGTASGNANTPSNDVYGLNNHAMILSGFLEIAAGGDYDLTLNSDDGSWLYIDGHLVVDDGGDHGMTVRTTSGFHLDAGEHSLLIWQQENGGYTGLSAYINGEALSGHWISATSTAVPEPASWALMLAGFGLVGGAMRSRKRSQPITA